MQTKIILAIVAVSFVAAALVGLTAAQFVTNQPSATASTNQVLPPCVTGDNGVVPPYCINATTGEPYCYNNDEYTGYCYQNGGCYGNGESTQNQYQYRYGCGGGMMGRTGLGRGW